MDMAIYRLYLYPYKKSFVERYRKNSTNAIVDRIFLYLIIVYGLLNYI